MASSTVWSDFETLRHSVKQNTVDRLKHILTGFNDECGTNLTKSGKKQELIDRITREMDNWSEQGNTERWTKAKAILDQVRMTGVYSPTGMSGGFGFGVSPSSHNAYPNSVSSSSHAYPSSVPGSTSSIPPYNPYAPARRPAVSSAPSSSTPSDPAPPIKFKPSPFYRVERAVSSLIECPESTSSMDRRQQTLHFQIDKDILSKLSSPHPKYQLRLYCTSSSFHTPANAFRPTSVPALIEFPPTCEVRVNGEAMSANLKGMKKKPGTAPPPDIGKKLRVTLGATNRVEMVYVNSQQPVQAKKYYIIVMLVETTTVEQLVDRLKKGKYKRGEEIRAQMAKAASIDDDIVAGHQKMSLKCPLSYMRIQTPCRSSHCVHPQCFDAFSWYSLMEQTTTWLCPVCEKVLNVEDLIVDGYFDNILKNTPDDVEDVIVEADGQWHTEDHKYGSTEWVTARARSQPAATQPPRPTSGQQSSSSPKKVSSVANGQDHRPANAEVVVLDSDDEDDDARVKRELSPSNDRATSSLASQSTRGSHSLDNAVIDLTLDSDDEEPAPPPPPPKKRKTMDNDLPSPTEQIWKKSRTDGASASQSSSHAGSGYPNGSRNPLPPPPMHSFDGSSSSYWYSPSYSPGAQQYSPPYFPPSLPPPMAGLPRHSIQQRGYSRTNGADSTSVLPDVWRP
ncbi:uncharacterized protein LAESUDRAFT_729877 [Laetiporus sulphureus 93-53]|uniref:PINIT domain-containing protein n=1 Tax=Laetiporus sulphureus 93-53 TaxID=1314785 RepID=A0A165CDY6_9APHY|nr:uncharacterized protein LAESUDRAFT_729877 [Laetiporus sulphureus 93-53]KZT02638.1 hypothetical protein LAESUDRAFT_729877 [Laetiporus sulphureus 93-53]